MIPIKINLPLKKVTERVKSTRAVTWALETYKGPLLEKLGQVFGPLLEEGQVMPFETQLTLFQQKLTAGCEEVVATDRAYRDQRALESKFRSTRDADYTELNSKVVVLRQAFGGIYSEEKLAEMGFARRTPQQPGELLEQATHLAFRLSEPNFDLDGAKVDGFQVDVPQAARELGPAAERLRLSVDNVTREERRSEAAMLAKDDALDEYNRTFLCPSDSEPPGTRVALCLSDSEPFGTRVAFCHRVPERLGKREALCHSGPERLRKQMAFCLLDSERLGRRRGTLPLAF